MFLLKADEGLTDPQIMAALNVSRPCVERIHKRLSPMASIELCMKTCGSEEARRIVKKLEFRYTPKHGGWLNVVG